MIDDTQNLYWPGDARPREFWLLQEVFLQIDKDRKRNFYYSIKLMNPAYYSLDQNYHSSI